MTHDSMLMDELASKTDRTGFAVRDAGEGYVTLACAENLECEVEVRREGSWYVFEGCVDSHRTKTRLLGEALDAERSRWIVDRIVYTHCPCSQAP